MTIPSFSVGASASPTEGPAGEPAGPGRLVLLTTTHRVAPGLLSWPAWQALHAADRVHCRAPDHPQLPPLAAAGVTVTEHPGGALPDLARLVAECAGGRTVVVLAADDGEPALTQALARLAESGRGSAPALELLPGSYDLPGARLVDVVRVMDEIRAHCPWTSRRTHADLAKYGLEEAYELVEAIEDGDRTELREELGDVLLQVVFHARIAEDHAEEAFGIDDVADVLLAKLIGRHPHVFGGERAESDSDVEAHWLRTKAAEKQRASVTDGVPLAQPALALAAKLVSRARRAGLAVPFPGGAEAATGDGTAAGAAAQTGAPRRGGQERIGYRLLALAAEAEAAGVDPETALRSAARAYRDALRSAEGAQDGGAAVDVAAGRSATDG